MLRCSIALASNYTPVVEFLGCSGIFGPCLFGPVVEFLERHRHGVVEFFGQHFNSTIALARRCTATGRPWRRLVTTSRAAGVNRTAGWLSAWPCAGALCWPGMRMQKRKQPTQGGLLLCSARTTLQGCSTPMRMRSVCAHSMPHRHLCVNCHANSAFHTFRLISICLPSITYF